MVSQSNLKQLALLLGLVAGVIGVFTIASRTEPMTNDDTYIYFNYARNFVEGRPFAYDSRNIPSEGFTSVLYLLLLVPFEAVGVNMMFATLVLNLAATALILAFAFRVVRDDKILDGPFIGVFVGIFALLLARDDHIPVVVGRGLETMLGPATILWAVIYVVRLHRDDDPQKRLASFNMFLVASFVSFLVRPENIVLLGAVGVLVLVAMWRAHQLRPLLLRLGGFVAVLVAYYGGKLMFFGDAFQTGYYRKVHAGLAGKKYVFGAINYYWPWLLVLGLVAVVMAALLLWPRRREGWKALSSLAPKSSLLALALAAAGTLVVFLPSHPLIGYAFRYLINFYVFVYLLVALAIASLLAAASQRLPARPVALVCVVLIVISILWSGKVAAGDKGFGVAVRRVRELHTRAVVSTGKHRYVRLGHYLRARIGHTEDLTLVFGDAGVLPYVLRSRFIDANGLTEPYIARLFKEPAGPEKATKFADYVLSWEPDIIVLGAGRTHRGRSSPRPNIHSPFGREVFPLSVHRAYLNSGFGYVCTGHAYYDLHFGVRKTSEHYNATVAALLDYCGYNGMVLKNGLTITVKDDEVHYPRLFLE